MVTRAGDDARDRDCVRRIDDSGDDRALASAQLETGARCR